MNTHEKVRLLFGGLSEEFDTLAGGIEAFNSLASEMVRAANDTTRSMAVEQAHAIDEVTYRCRALSSLIDALLREVPFGDALQAMPLSAVDERLTLALQLTSPPNITRSKTGDLMLLG